jgi:hypothetical protein
MKLCVPTGAQPTNLSVSKSLVFRTLLNPTIQNEFCFIVPISVHIVLITGLNL